MNKSNVLRCVFWGIVFTICSALAFGGLIAYHNGYGVLGKIRHNVMPIVDAFNNLDSLKEFNQIGVTIKANIGEQGLLIKYSSDANGYNYSFEYDYENIAGIPVLRSSFTSENENYAKVVLRYLIEAVSVVNGYNEGDVFEHFSLDDFYNTSVDNGISLNKSNNNINVVINLNKSILDSLNEIENNNNKSIFSDVILSLYQFVLQNYDKDKSAAVYYYDFENNCIIDNVITTPLMTLEKTKYYIVVDENGIISTFDVVSDSFAHSLNENSQFSSENLNIIDRHKKEDDYLTILNKLNEFCVKKEITIQ